MNILHVVIHDNKGFPQLFGVTDKNEVVRYDMKTGQWLPFVKSK